MHMYAIPAFHAIFDDNMVTLIWGVASFEQRTRASSLRLCSEPEFKKIVELLPCGMEINGETAIRMEMHVASTTLVLTNASALVVVGGRGTQSSLSESTAS